MTLIVKYKPHADESGLGFYRRLTDDNALSNWRELAGLAGVQHTRSALLGRPDFVAEQLGLESEWAHFASRQEADCCGWGRLHRVQSDAVCPVCLAEAPYLRHAWGHAYVTVCPTHRIQLVDRCNECGETLSPHRYHIDRCDCGHELSLLPRVDATASQLWLSTLISSAGKQSGGIEPTVRSVDVAALARVARTLCLYANPVVPTLRYGAASPRSVAEAIDLLRPLDALLADWPSGFQGHVVKRIQCGRADARTLNTLLGPWYINLRKLCQGTALEPFLTAVIEVAAKQFDGVLGMDSAKEMAADATEYVRAPDAAKIIGVSVSRLHAVMHAGECDFRTRLVGTRGRIYEIPRIEVERILQSRSEWIGFDQACVQAGVPPSVLNRMMAAEVIRSDVNWKHDILKGGPVERRSLLELFERVRDAAESSRIANTETLKWTEFTTRRLGDNLAIQSLMRAILEGKVNAVVRGLKLGDMAFRGADVTEYFGTPLLEAGMSIQQLSKVTGWKWESISHWISLGLLESESIVLRGQACRVVLPHQLLAFRQAYVPLADLARGMGTKSSALSRLLSSVELVGAQELPSGAARGGLLRMRDLGQLAVIGARAGRDLFVPESAPHFA